MGGHGRVDEHLVVIELVPLGRLDESVEQENTAVILVADDLDPLELRLFFVENFLDGEEDPGGAGLVFPGLGFFRVERFGRFHVLLSSRVPIIAYAASPSFRFQGAEIRIIKKRVAEVRPRMAD